MELYQHQKNLVTLNPTKYLIAWSTGVGKTRASIALAKSNSQYLPLTLIIVPKALKANWKRECQEHGLSALIVTKEEFRRDWDKLPACNGLILDEMHFFANLKSQLSKALIKYQRKHSPQFVWGLTATPYLSSPQNIFALATHLGHVWNWWKFQNQFYTYVKMGRRMIPKIKTGIEDDIGKLVNIIGSTVRLEDLIDVPDQIDEVEYFDLTAEQERAIKDVDATDFIVRWTKIHQLMGGTMKGNEYEEDIFVKSNKLERLKDLVTENKKTIVVCRYNNEIKMLERELKDIAPVKIINGQVKDKDAVLQDLKDKDSYCLIVNAVCSEGWEKPDCPVMIFYSLDFSLKNKVQMIGRIQRINFPKKNVYITLVVRKSIDEDVYKSLEKKINFQLAIYNPSNK